MEDHNAYEPCRFLRYNRLFIRVNDENSEFRLSCEDSAVTADYALISGIVQGLTRTTPCRPAFEEFACARHRFVK